jgi:hypothetical protein
MTDFTQVETSEIADGDLDAISGGFSVSGGAGSGPVSVSGGVSVDGVEGLVGAATSALPSVATPALPGVPVAGGLTL